MERINNILKHPQYIENMNRLMKAEKQREFCRHTIQHFLDVARIAYIKSLEKGLKLDQEVIYGAALLHDIGRWKQYEDGSDHALVSSSLAKGILIDCDFGEDEITMIRQAIEKHRRGTDLITELDVVIYEGDKASRLCNECKMRNECNRLEDGDEFFLQY
ncbi:HD domain-containing protein [Alkaliphilus hydrothermalis]|uniref:Nucleotidyltransferase with HDIG domain n=1 Tax=Alkaliphilus hydrothermalis TaxID=1482730 RepID=A0ABS2NPR7_9FIRM|nr:HD domain-containing protein [Alkaliphilus hydrothermalis]MBM7614939.1 putative nucleotidyltransferase with HDIG domain [Alkaliphilus hydrothermalis]